MADASQFQGKFDSKQDTRSQATGYAYGATGAFDMSGPTTMQTAVVGATDSFKLAAVAAAALVAGAVIFAAAKRKG